MLAIRLRLWLAGLLVWTVLGAAWPPPVAQAISQPDLNRALLATVKLWSLNARGKTFAGCSGSIVDPGGVILTAWHCVGYSPHEEEDPSEQGLKPGQLYHPKGWLLVGPTLDPKLAPKQTYVAEYRDGSPKLDVAVLKIVSMVDDTQPLPNPLNLPTVPIGNSQAVQIKDPVHVLGYPGVGGPRITVTSGTVSGFDDTAGDGNIDTLKLDASVSSGHSGGPTVDDGGKIIGINSWGLSEGADKVDRVVMVHVAQPYLSRVMGGGGASPPGPAPSVDNPFGAIRFGTDFASGKLVGEGTTFPVGTKQVCGAWDYTGMKNGTPWGRVWRLDGDVIIDKRKADTWSDGASGTQAYCYTPDTPLEAGKWELYLYLNGKQIQSGTFRVGAAPTPTPVTAPKFGAIRFGTDFSNDRLIGETTSFPTGTTRIYAAWDYSGMKDGTPWGRIWYLNGQIDTDKRSGDTWDAGASGTMSWYYDYTDGPLPDGNYELALLINGQEVQRGAFSVGGRGTGPTPPNTGQTMLTGKVVDSVTGAAIGGATVMVVKPGTTFDQWKAVTNKDPLIVVQTTADASGSFTTPPVARGQTYPLAIRATGYGTTFFWNNLAVNVPTSAGPRLDTGTWDIEHD